MGREKELLDQAPPPRTQEKVEVRRLDKYMIYYQSKFLKGKILNIFLKNSHLLRKPAFI